MKLLKVKVQGDYLQLSLLNRLRGGKVSEEGKSKVYVQIRQMSSARVIRLMSFIIVILLVA